jgi:hypothetical protein
VPPFVAPPVLAALPLLPAVLDVMPPAPPVAAALAPAIAFALAPAIAFALAPAIAFAAAPAIAFGVVPAFASAALPAPCAQLASMHAHPRPIPSAPRKSTRSRTVRIISGPPGHPSSLERSARAAQARAHRLTTASGHAQRLASYSSLRKR